MESGVHTPSPRGHYAGPKVETCTRRHRPAALEKEESRIGHWVLYRFKRGRRGCGTRQPKTAAGVRDGLTVGDGALVRYRVTNLLIKDDEEESGDWGRGLRCVALCCSVLHRLLFRWYCGCGVLIWVARALYIVWTRPVVASREGGGVVSTGVACMTEYWPIDDKLPLSLSILGPCSRPEGPVGRGVVRKDRRGCRMSRFLNLSLSLTHFESWIWCKLEYHNSSHGFRKLG